MCVYRMDRCINQMVLVMFSAGLSPRRSGFGAKPIRVTFVVYKVPLAHVFLPVLRFSPVTIIPPMLQTHHHHLNTVLMRRASGRSLGTLKESNALSYTVIKSRSIRWVGV